LLIDLLFFVDFDGGDLSQGELPFGLDWLAEGRCATEFEEIWCEEEEKR
jgi:hypothetical protein